MVVQGISLPATSGSTRDQEIAADPDALPAGAASTGRTHRTVLVPLLVALQVAWLALLGYGALRLLL